MIYLDGTALCRFLPGVRHSEAWTAWVVGHEGDLVTSPLGLTELRQAAALYPREQLAEVTATVERVRQLVPQVRFSDDNVTISSHATSVLKPFAALHIGAAVGGEGVDQIATYDPSLAHVAEIYRLKVVTPGLETGWYLTFEGPPDTWKPIGLDAPYDPGAEFLVPGLEPLDPFEEALLEVEAQATQHESEAAKAEPDIADSGTDDEPVLVYPVVEDAVVEDAVAADLTSSPPIFELELPSTPERRARVVGLDPKPEPAINDAVVAEPAPVVAVPASVVVEPARVEFAASDLSVGTVERERAAEPPPAAEEESPSAYAPPVAAEAAPLAEGSAQESEASRRRAEMIARLGQYRPKVEAWQEDEAALTPGVAGESPTPLAATPEPAFDEPPEAEVPVAIMGEVPDAAAVESDEAPRAVPIGQPVRRPALRRPSVLRPLAETPIAPQDEFPTIVPTLPTSVHIEDPTSYSPERFETTGELGASHPFSRSGPTAAMSADPLGTLEIPLLEPIATEGPGFGGDEEVLADVPPKVKEVAKEAKAPESRWRRGKGKGRAPESKPASSAPSDEDSGWSLEDILGPGGGRG